MAARASSISASAPDSSQPPSPISARASCESLPRMRRQRRICSGSWPAGVVMVVGPYQQGRVVSEPPASAGGGSAQGAALPPLTREARCPLQIPEVELVEVLQRLLLGLGQRLLDGGGGVVALQ